MSKITVTLTATNCFEALSKKTPEADFDAWVAFVAKRNPEWTVEGDFSERVRDNEVDAFGREADRIRDDINAEWDAFCGDESAWPEPPLPPGMVAGKSFTLRART